MRALPPESLLRAAEHIPPPPRDARRRVVVENALDNALRANRAGLVLLRGPRGAGRRTALALWARRLVRDGTLVVWVDVEESRALDGETLGTAINMRLAHVTGESSAASTAAETMTVEHSTVERMAAALDARELVLVVDRLGPASCAALSYLDRIASLLGRSHVIALTALPLAGPAPTFGGWTHDPVARGAADRVELTLRDLAVRPAEAQAAAASLGTPLNSSQARLLVTATAGWPVVTYPALAEICRATAAGEPVTDDLVAMVAAAQRAAFLRAVLPEEAINVLVEASLAPQFSRDELEATCTLATVPDSRWLIERLVQTGFLLDDPASPDDVLAVEPRARRALLDYARGRDRDKLCLRATNAARRRERARDPRGALLIALESGNPDLVRDLLRTLWTDVLDGHDPTMPEALWSAASSMTAPPVPAELRALLSVTRSAPGRPSRREPLADRPGTPDDPLLLFVWIARLRGAGHAADALGLARPWLQTTASAPGVARVLVGLQASVTAAEEGLLHEALQYAETAHHGALSAGALSLAAAAAETAALVHALDSDVRAAADWSAEADDLPAPPGWWRHRIGDAPALISALTRLEGLKADLPAHLLGVAQDAARSDLWFAGLHVEAMLAILRSQEELAVNRLRDVLSQHAPTASATEMSARGIRVPPLIALDLVRLHLALGLGTSARVIADAVTANAPARALLDGQLRLAQGQPRAALQAITTISSAREGSTAGTSLQAHLIAGAARTAIGDIPGARRELAHAADLAVRAGGGLPLWWAGADVLRSIADAAPDLGEQVAQVLRRRGAPADVEFVVVPDRQLAVLHGLADGLTSTQVAKASFVSPNTVKTQIREIYRRLGVHDRTAAIQRARELGLLDPIVRARLRATSPSRS